MKSIGIDEKLLIDKRGIAELVGYKNIRSVDSLVQRHADFPMYAVFHRGGRGMRCKWYRDEVQEWIAGWRNPAARDLP